MLVQLETGPVLVAWQNASAAAVIAFAVCTLHQYLDACCVVMLVRCSCFSTADAHSMTVTLHCNIAFQIDMRCMKTQEESLAATVFVHQPPLYAQANASSLAFNATEPGFAPASVAPLLQGDFAGAYAAGVASPFVSLNNGTAAGGQTLPQLIANVSDGQVKTALTPQACKLRDSCRLMPAPGIACCRERAQIARWLPVGKLCCIVRCTRV